MSVLRCIQIDDSTRLSWQPLLNRLQKELSVASACIFVYEDDNLKLLAKTGKAISDLAFSKSDSPRVLQEIITKLHIDPLPAPPSGRWNVFQDHSGKLYSCLFENLKLSNGDIFGKLFVYDEKPRPDAPNTLGKLHFIRRIIETDINSQDKQMKLEKAEQILLAGMEHSIRPELNNLALLASGLSEVSDEKQLRGYIRRIAGLANRSCARLDDFILWRHLETGDIDPCAEITVFKQIVNNVLISLSSLIRERNQMIQEHLHPRQSTAVDPMIFEVLLRNALELIVNATPKGGRVLIDMPQPDTVIIKGTPISAELPGKISDSLPSGGIPCTHFDLCQAIAKHSKCQLFAEFPEGRPSVMILLPDYPGNQDSDNRP